MRPLKNSTKPSAEKITSVLKSTVEVATEVQYSDSTHRAKCAARKTPERMQPSAARRERALNSARRIAATGSIRATVQPSRKVKSTREGAPDRRTKIAEKADITTPKAKTALGLESLRIIRRSPLSCIQKQPPPGWDERLQLATVAYPPRGNEATRRK
ncbi:hypothetical protein SDC9_187953 [bioreactor metagenome]|uniref:Uncharacterized protein n=1 Tax=bioreactor metagenome TaxID=1076179 RepID=A0A645HPA8_9ZZZZ